MSMRGSPRQTQHVDIAVETTMEYLKAIILQISRLSVSAIHGQTSIQIFVHTGGEFDTGYRAYAVSADIIINSNLNTPHNIPNGTELITPTVQQTPLGSNQIHVVDIFFQFNSKLDAFNTRRATGRQGNDYEDLVWLLTNHANEVYYCRNALNYDHRALFFQDFAARNSPENANYARTILGIDQTTG